jgi:Subtilase family
MGRRRAANVDRTSLPGNSAGDGYGHGTLVAGLAAGLAPRYTGAAPTAGIVSLDVMDDQGMARTGDVIAAAQWILDHHDEYDIRVANFSLHSSVASSFRRDPLDKAVEKLWFSGVVVVASSGNEGRSQNQPVRMGFAPANDPFVVTVGALDLHNSTNTEQTSVAPWSGPGVVFDDVSWHDAAKASSSWNAVSWSDGWDSALWPVSSWATVSWSDVSWSDVSWSDVSWSDVSCED